MAKKISRRHMLSLTAAAVGGVTALAAGAQATPTGPSRALSTGGWSAVHPADAPVLGTNLQRRPGACQTVTTGAPWEGLQARGGPDGLYAAV